MKVIGLTGGIASGKSLVSTWFEALDITVIDADKVYKRLVSEHAGMRQAISDAFDLKTHDDGKIDFASLANVVFNDQEKLQRLNQVTHPFVIEEIDDMVDTLRKKCHDLVVLDVPLLFEAKMEKNCDWVICVYVDKETQVSRLMKRDQMDKVAALKRIESQMDLEEKKERSDFVIDNSMSKTNSYQQFQQIIKKII